MFAWGGFFFFISGAGGKVNLDDPKNFADARTVSWGKGGHFLLVKIEGSRMEIHPVGEGGPLPLRTPNGGQSDVPIIVTR